MKKNTQKNRKKPQKRNKAKRKKNKTKRVYSKNDFKSGDGMITAVWGPSLWHYLHVMSFNYPVKPSCHDKKNYKNFIYSLKKVLPCKYCRINMKKNLKSVPLNKKALASRDGFSRWMYNLHEHINKMLGKKSGLTYCKVRERYEHFRARCTIDITDKNVYLVNKSKTIKKSKVKKHNKTKKKKEKGCTEPLYGKKSKCLIRIVPKENREKTLKIDKKCIKKRI